VEVTGAVVEQDLGRVWRLGAVVTAAEDEIGVAVVVHVRERARGKGAPVGDARGQ
jgi:hypothetical protein